MQTAAKIRLDIRSPNLCALIWSLSLFSCVIYRNSVNRSNLSVFGQNERNEQNVLVIRFILSILQILSQPTETHFSGIRQNEQMFVSGEQMQEGERRRKKVLDYAPLGAFGP